MAEILLDTKFWNKVYKLLKPATVVAVKKNKGSGKYCLIPSTGSGNLNKANNMKGFLIRYMNTKSPYAQNYLLGSRRYKGEERRVRIIISARENGLTEARIKEIERAIVQVAASENLLPESVLYDGKPVTKTRKQPDKLTAGFGFVYFVRNDEIYKIGITDNLLRRISELKPDEIINVVRCVNYKDLEKKLHSKFKSSRIPQTEYFRLDQGEVSLVNELMTDLAQFRE